MLGCITYLLLHTVSLDKWIVTEQLAESRMVDRHRCVLEVECDAMLIIIAVRAVLQSPLRIVDRDGDDAVIFTGRMRQRPGIALVLRAEKAFRIVR